MTHISYYGNLILHKQHRRSNCNNKIMLNTEYSGTYESESCSATTEVEVKPLFAADAGLKPLIAGLVTGGGAIKAPLVNGVVFTEDTEVPGTRAADVHAVVAVVFAAD